MEPISFAAPLVSLFLAVMTLIGGGFVQPDDGYITTQSVSGETVEADIILATELEVYGTDSGYVRYSAVNTTDQMIMYGYEWHLERLIDSEVVPATYRDSAWQVVEFPDNTAFPQPSLWIMPGETLWLKFDFDDFKYELDAGIYRIVKEFGDDIYAAEFVIVDAVDTDEAADADESADLTEITGTTESADTTEPTGADSAE